MPFSFLFLSLLLVFSLLLLKHFFQWLLKPMTPNNELIFSIFNIQIQIKIVFCSVSGHLGRACKRSYLPAFSLLTPV